MHRTPRKAEDLHLGHKDKKTPEMTSSEQVDREDTVVTAEYKQEGTQGTLMMQHHCCPRNSISAATAPTRKTS